METKTKLDFRIGTKNFYDFGLNIEKREITETLKDIAFFKIDKITFEEDEKMPRKEAFENVLGTIRERGVNFIYLILGNEMGVSFYMGLVKDSDATVKTPIRDLVKDLRDSALGNFRGSEITLENRDECLKIINTIKETKNFGQIDGIPGINPEHTSFQGIERIIDIMGNKNWGLCIVAKPLTDIEITNIERTIYDCYDEINKYSKVNLQLGQNSSVGSQESDAFNYSHSTNESDTSGETKTKSASLSSGKSVSTSTTEGTSYSHGKSNSHTKSDSNNSGNTDTTNSSSGGSSSSSGESHSSTMGHTNGISDTQGNSENWSENSGSSETYSKNNSESSSKSTSKNDSYTKGISDTEGTSHTTGTNRNSGNSITAGIEIGNREYVSYLKYIDDTLLPIIQNGKSKGLFVNNFFIFSDNKGVLDNLGNNIVSIFSDNPNNKNPLSFKKITDEEYKSALANFEIPKRKANLPLDLAKTHTLASQYIFGENIYNNWYSASELALVAGLPKREVSGLIVNKEIEFGLNIPKDIADPLYLGNLVKSGRELEKMSVEIDRKQLSKHIFVAGTTGSGKTTTCQTLLMESKLPFMVVEPAKTEYRTLMEEDPEIVVFTLGDDNIAPFRLNPFEFQKGEKITSRMQMIIGAISSSFEMEAAIPQIIESAIEECYKDYGWDIATDENESYDDPFDKNVIAFPTINDLINKIDSEVEKQNFDERLKKDYIGSIKARLQGLTKGAKGLILNTHRGVDFRKLLDKRVVFELDEIRDRGEKSLFMAFILTNLQDAIKYRHKKDRDFTHLTLIEEAHNLLADTRGINENRRRGVELFTGMLAENREFGECFIIVDQIPSKLTTDVLKNTNTKIIHKLMAGDDKDAVGETMQLTREQREFLSSLKTGRTILYSHNFDKPLQVQIKMRNNKSRSQLTEDKLKERAIKFYTDNYDMGVFGVLSHKPSFDDIDNIIKLSKSLDTTELFLFLQGKVDEFELIRKILADKGLKRFSRKMLDRFSSKNYKNLENFESGLSTRELAIYLTIKYFTNDNKDDVFNEIVSILEAMKSGIEYNASRTQNWIKENLKDEYKKI